MRWKKIVFYFVGYLTKIKENVKDERVKTLWNKVNKEVK